VWLGVHGEQQGGGTHLLEKTRLRRGGREWQWLVGMEKGAVAAVVIYRCNT
jgi:hypothetical protein